MPGVNLTLEPLSITWVRPSTNQHATTWPTQWQTHQVGATDLANARGVEGVAAGALVDVSQFAGGVLHLGRRRVHAHEHAHVEVDAHRQHRNDVALVTRGGAARKKRRTTTLNPTNHLPSLRTRRWRRARCARPSRGSSWRAATSSGTWRNRPERHENFSVCCLHAIQANRMRTSLWLPQSTALSVHVTAIRPPSATACTPESRNTEAEPAPTNSKRGSVRS